MNAQTYLFFDGSCEEGINFYTEALGAEVVYMMRFSEGPAEFVPPGGEEKIFHATIRLGDTLINMSDDLKRERAAFGGFAILLHVDDNGDAEAFFTALSQGGVVRMPLTRTSWASKYGIVTDKFGIVWKVQSTGKTSHEF
jgi:PhnB protein